MLAPLVTMAIAKNNPLVAAGEAGAVEQSGHRHTGDDDQSG